MHVTHPRPAAHRPGMRATTHRHATPVARPHMPRRRKPAPPSKGQMLLAGLSKVLPTGTTDAKKRKGKTSTGGGKGKTGLMLLAAGGAAAFAKKRKDGKQREEVLVTEPVTPVVVVESAVADAPAVRRDAAL